MATALRKMIRPRLDLRSRLTQWRETEAGQSLVEFAMVLPMFLLMLFALVDFGRGFYTWLVVTNAAREGARAAAVQLDQPAVYDKIYNSFCDSYPSNCSLEPGRMSITPNNIQGRRGEEVTIRIAYDFGYVTPIGDILRFVSGGTLTEPTITATSSMRLE
ncbi:MAG: pilus assembly protein [Dehalococcoidia bacterium]|nr:pilus assembly protein [Dehalococcoidia bacterium]